MGFAWGVSGFILPSVGILSDVFGLQTILLCVVLLDENAKTHEISGGVMFHF